MALVVNDRVKETSTTTGTGTFTLDGAVTGFETFSSAIGNTNTTYYAIALQGGAEFEVGLGTVAAGTLARTTIISSSNSDSAVDFSAGKKMYFVHCQRAKRCLKMHLMLLKVYQVTDSSLLCRLHYSIRNKLWHKTLEII